MSFPQGLCLTLSSFYLSLFTASLPDLTIWVDLLSNINSKLSDDQSVVCEGLLCIEEVSCALRGMAQRKSPGLDGLLMEFYLKFCDLLGSDLVTVLNSCFLSGIGSISPISQYADDT